MRKLSLLLVLTLVSCGYSVKSEKELQNYEYNITDLEQQFEDFKTVIQAEKDSLVHQAVKSRLELERYKDSITYMDLTRIMCYQSTPHRHSCEIYK